jgi:hypothetical protein
MRTFPKMKNILLLFLLCLTTLLPIRAQTAGSVNIRLPEVSGFRLTLLSSNRVSTNNICVAGYAFDPEEAKSVAIGIILNTRTLNVSWAKSVKPKAELYQNRFTGCFAGSGKVFFVEESDTQASPQLSQVMINLSSVSLLQPNVVDHHPLWEQGKKNWLIGLFSAGPKAMIVLGHASEADTPDAEMTAHRLSLDPFAPEPPVTIKHGAFLPGSNLILDEKKLTIAGRFAKSGLDSEATLTKAAISPAGHYIWASPLSSNVLVGGPDKQGRLIEALHDSEHGTISFVDVVGSGTAGVQLVLPNRGCVPQWLLPDTALISRSCTKDLLTIHRLDKLGRTDIKLSLPKAVSGPTAVLLYSPVESSANGYSFGVIAP